MGFWEFKGIVVLFFGVLGRYYVNWNLLTIKRGFKLWAIPSVTPSSLKCTLGTEALKVFILFKATLHELYLFSYRGAIQKRLQQ